MLILLNKIANFIFLDNGILISFFIFSLLKANRSIINIAVLLFFAMIVNFILKNIIQAPLPVQVPYNFTQSAWDGVRAINYGMPSGHTTFISIFVLSFLIESSKLSQSYARKVIFFIILPLFFTKLFLVFHFGYHFIEDVVIAFIISILQILFYYKYIENDKKRLIKIIAFNIFCGFILIKGIIFKNPADHLIKGLILNSIIFFYFILKNTEQRINYEKN